MRCLDTADAKSEQNALSEGFCPAPPGPLLVRGGGGENLWGRLTQGDARFTSLALGYSFSGLRPFRVEPRDLGCYGCDSWSGQGRIRAGKETAVARGVETFFWSCQGWTAVVLPGVGQWRTMNSVLNALDAPVYPAGPAGLCGGAATEGRSLGWVFRVGAPNRGACPSRCGAFGPAERPAGYWGSLEVFRGFSTFFHMFRIRSNCAAWVSRPASVQTT